MRGKLYELIALRDLAENITSFKEFVIPIIEPIRLNMTGLKRSIESLIAGDIRFIIIVNPKCGELVQSPETFIINFVKVVLKGYKKCSFGYIIDSDTTIKNIDNIISLNLDCNLAFIHRDNGLGMDLKVFLDGKNNVVDYHIFDEDKTNLVYRRFFKDIPIVLLKDGFRSNKRNSDYPFSEHFSDLHLRAEELLIEGFSDFLIVGDNYSDSGGPAYAVAIHITHFDEDSDMRIEHFISDSNNRPVNPGGKFLEALEKLIKYSQNSIGVDLNTIGMKEFYNLYSNKHFPGLGVVKKLSMMHHIETIVCYLSR